MSKYIYIPIKKIYISIKRKTLEKYINTYIYICLEISIRIYISMKKIYIYQYVDISYIHIYIYVYMSFVICWGPACQISCEAVVTVEQMLDCCRILKIILKQSLTQPMLLCSQIPLKSIAIDLVRWPCTCAHTQSHFWVHSSLACGTIYEHIVNRLSHQASLLQCCCQMHFGVLACQWCWWQWRIKTFRILEMHTRLHRGHASMHTFSIAIAILWLEVSGAPDSISPLPHQVHLRVDALELETIPEAVHISGNGVSHWWYCFFCPLDLGMLGNPKCVFEETHARASHFNCFLETVLVGFTRTTCTGWVTINKVLPFCELFGNFLAAAPCKDDVNLMIHIVFLGTAITIGFPGCKTADVIVHMKWRLLIVRCVGLHQEGSFLIVLFDTKDMLHFHIHLSWLEYSICEKMDFSERKKPLYKKHSAFSELIILYT